MKGSELIGFREVPSDNSTIGEIAQETEPIIRQIMVGADLPQDELERKLYIIRKRAEKYIRASSMEQKRYFYIPSLSTKVLIYKGMLTSEQLGRILSGPAGQKNGECHRPGSFPLQHKHFSQLGPGPTIQHAGP